MAGNSFGRIFKISTYGESHGHSIGVVIDGVPPGLDLSKEIIQKDLDRRRPGQSSVTTPRNEADQVTICSGVFEGKTTGAPIHLSILNTNQQSKDYSQIKNIHRPGHADYTYQEKYGIRDYRGGGRSSGRETAARVAAGSIAKIILGKLGIKIVAFTKKVGHIEALSFDVCEIENNAIRCADPKKAQEMIHLIESMKEEGDSIGGIVGCLIQGVPVGWGEPAFDKLDALLSHACMSIATVKGIAFGEGFNVATKKGSENNDAYTLIGDEIVLKTNYSGGITGGISNGADICFDLAIKPPSSISKKQDTVSQDKKETAIQVKGRHDPCICPRVVPVVEAMVALTLVDMMMLHKAYTS